MDELLIMKIQDTVEKYGKEREFLIPILKKIQKINKYNYIPQEVSQYLAKYMQLKESEVYEVISFYAEFSETPRGENVIKVCDNTVCRVNNNNKTVKVLESLLSIKMGETTPDKKFSLEYSPCFGACDISPAMRINGKIYGNLDKKSLKEIIEYYQEVEL
ncbi:MAG: NAD(P)H-dependent oxidoreductase subunit E [Bacillota bacterium]|nr:NAD(P)H-dependent oxidoreductase subunit E [Bacillota bacterium]